MSAEHLSLNGYSRSTTPFLESLQRDGRLSNWGRAAATATYSDASVCTLLTGFDAYPDLEHRVFTLPTIFQFAKAMRYTTHLFDGEFSGRRFGLSGSDMRDVDDWRTTRDFGDDYDTDVRIAHAASDALAQPAGQFIVILKRGNHTPPEDNAPVTADEWLPSRHQTVPADQAIAAITNSYDNAVRYNLDAFFRALLTSDGRLPRTVGLYTSDHAEALGDDGREPFVRTISREVVTIPLFMFGDDRPAVDTAYRAGHQNVFPTMLDLLGVPDSARSWRYGRSLLQARESDRDQRAVLGGFMFGPRFFFEVRDFDDLTRVLASSRGAQ
jgi:lipid A ethanolaminephosphotransferase